MGRKSIGVGCEGDGGYGLTPAEKLVVQTLVTGLNRREIAEHLNISLNTVESHLACVYRKMGVHTAPAAIAKCFNEHIIKDGDR